MRSRNIFSSAFQAFAACPWWLHAAILLAMVILRQPGHLLYPQFWAEDGPYWYKEAYDYGAACLVMPHTGYLQTISRIGGLVASHLPLVMGPAVFFLIALVAQLAPLIYLLSPLGAPVCPSKECRVVLSYLYVALPNVWELHVNLTNAMSHLALLGVLVLMGETPKSKWGIGSILTLMALIGLSGPFSLFLAPIALWQWWQKRDRMAMANILVLSMTALVQGIFLFLSMYATRSKAPLGATIPRLARILSGEIVMGSLLGSRITSKLMFLPFWKTDWIPCLIALFGLAVIVVAVKTGPDSFRKFGTYSALLLTAALSTPQVTASMPQWEAMSICMTGTRYFFLPMLTWFSALLVLSQNKHRALRYLAFLLLGTASIGIVNDWTCPRFQHYEEFMEQARQFDSAPSGTQVEIPINPDGWKLKLTKH